MEQKDMLLASATIVAGLMAPFLQGLPDGKEEAICLKAVRMAMILNKKITGTLGE